MVSVLFQEIERQTIITSRMAVTQVAYVPGRMPLELAAKWSSSRLYAAAGNSTRVLVITFSFVADFTGSNPILGPNGFGRDGSPGPSKPLEPGSEWHLMEVV
jgi:hypothetical protein